MNANARKFLASEVTFTLKVETDSIPVRGNAIATEDEARDKEVEDSILADIERGNVWAWAYVEVQAEWAGFDGMASLGACSYKDADQFAAEGEEGYLGQLVREALESAIDGADFNGWPVDRDPIEMAEAITAGVAEMIKDAKAF